MSSGRSKRAAKCYCQTANLYQLAPSSRQRRLPVRSQTSLDEKAINMAYLNKEDAAFTRLRALVRSGYQADLGAKDSN